MDPAARAKEDLFPDRRDERRFSVRYSGRFARYNANVRYTRREVVFSLSKAFLEVSEEIRQGVIEHLLCKVYGEDRPSMNQDLYRSFMRHLNKVAVIDEKDPFLLSRFKVINEGYFNGMMTEPNLKWGQESFRKLGHYEYSSDTIVISKVFSKAVDDEKVRGLLDYVLYHEMLHKKHQYDHTKKRARHHTKAFKEDEKKWHDPDVERKLRSFLGKKRLRKALWDW